MTSSLYPQGTKNLRPVASDSLSAGAKTTLRLNKDHLINEHEIYFDLTATFADATTAYSEVDLGALVSNIALNVSGSNQNGNQIRMDGLTARIMGAVHETQDVADVSVGTTTTVSMMIDLHHAMEDASRSLLTALRGDLATSIDLEITMAPLADWLLAFTVGGAGAAPTAATGTVTVYSHELQVADYDQLPEVGSRNHFQVMFAEEVASSGNLTINLDTGNRTRGLLVVVDDGDGALDDDLVSDVSLVVAGVVRLQSKFSHMRRRAVKYNGLDYEGVIYYEFSDWDVGFLDLTTIQQARLVFTTTDAARVRVVQDYLV